MIYVYILIILLIVIIWIWVEMHNQNGEKEHEYWSSFIYLTERQRKTEKWGELFIHKDITPNIGVTLKEKESHVEYRYKISNTDYFNVNNVSLYYKDKLLHNFIPTSNTNIEKLNIESEILPYLYIKVESKLHNEVMKEYFRKIVPKIIE